MADKTINELTAATTMGNDDLLVLQQGGAAKKLSGKQLGDYVYNAAAEKVAEVNKAVDDARSSINDIVESVQSMTELGTDTTLTTTGMAADAKAAGDKIKAVETAALADLSQGTASGSIVTITDGADNIPIKKMTVDIEPVQAGSGDPSPDNVRPITGRTGMNIYNMHLPNGYTPVDYITLTGTMPVEMDLDFNREDLVIISEYKQNTRSTYAFLYAVYSDENTNSTRLITGTAGGVVLINNASIASSPSTSYVSSLSKFNKIVSYYMGGSINGQAYTTGGFHGTNTNNKTMVFGSTKQSTSFRYFYIRSSKINGAVPYYCLIACTNPNGIAGMYDICHDKFYTTDDPTKCVASGVLQTKLDIMPYAAITFPSEAGTVYGGKLEINEDGSGALTVDRGIVVFDGTNSGMEFDSGTEANRIAWSGYNDIGVIGGDALVSDKLKTTAMSSGIKASPWLVYTGNSSPRMFMTVPKEIDSVKAFQEYAATNPITVAYKIATPQVYLLTAQQITTLLGTNNIWADTGDISEFIYRKAPVDSSDIDAKITAIESIISGREIAMIATKNYTFGSLVIVNDILYRLDTNVASGETLTPGTNCHMTTVEAELAECIPNYRSVNGKDLSSDITLSAEDIPYDDTLAEHTSGSVGEVVNSLKESIDGINTDSYIELSSADLQQGSWQENAQIEAATSRLCTKVLYNVIAGMKIVYNSTAAMQIMIKVYGEDGTLLESTSWTSGVDEEVTFICKYSGRLGISWRRTSDSYMSIAYYDQNNASTKIYNTMGAKIKLLGEEVSNLNGLSGEVGSGNAYYTGERISLAITPTIRKCQIDLWKEYTTTEFPDLNTYSLTANQSMAIYGNYVFLGLSGGSVCIIDRITKAPISISTLPITTNNHLNSAQFTDIFYDTADEFPLLLLSKCALISTGANNNICQVYRITRTDSTFTFTLINTITTDFPTGGIDWVIDISNRKLGIVGYIPAKENKTSVRTWNCPTATEIMSGTAISMKEADVLNAFEFEQFDSQAAFALGGLIFVGKGLGNAPESVEVIDVEKAMIVSSVKLISTAEVEGVYIFDGKLYVSQRLASNASKPVSIYEITF